MIPESHRNTDTPFWLYLPAGIIQKMGVPRGRPNGVTVQMALKIFYFLFHRQNDGASSLPHSLFFRISGRISLSYPRKGGPLFMGGNYEKGMYRQLMDVMARLDVMETEHKKDRKEISSLTSEVESFCKENSRFRTELAQVKEENSVLQKGRGTARSMLTIIFPKQM